MSKIIFSITVPNVVRLSLSAAEMCQVANFKIVANDDLIILSVYDHEVTSVGSPRTSLSTLNAIGKFTSD